MTTHTRLRLGAVALVLLVVVLLSGAHLCGVAQDPGSRPLSTGALACTEFWLNRYQTLFGAASALAAAAIAWIGVRRQISKSDEQIASSIRQNSIAILPIFDERIKNAVDIFEQADKISETGTKTFQGARQVYEKAQSALDAHNAKFELKPSVNEFQLAINEFQKQTTKVFSELEIFIRFGFDAVAGKLLRQACYDLWSNIYNANMKSIEIVDNILDCVPYNKVTEDQLEKFKKMFSDVDFAKYEDGANEMIEPLRRIGALIENFQDERDRIFEASRR